MKKKIIIIVFLLGIISIINLYNTSFLSYLYKYYYLKQLLWYLIGFVILFLLSKINIEILFKYSKLLYYINLLLLILVLFFGDKVNGSRAWFNFKIISFQPSEIMKISLALLLTNEACKHSKNIVFKLFIYTIIPSLLVFIEPDTGAIIFYFITLIVILICLKLNYKFYLIMILLFGISTFLIIHLYLNNPDILINIFGKSIFYRADRFINFKTNNYQMDLALTSVYSSSLFQNGFKYYNINIPECPTDFIFAFSIGSFGLSIAFIIIILYLLLFKNIINLINYSNNKKTNYLIISFLWILICQVFINMSMNIGMIPIIGITLPFLSYGGSSLLTNFIFLGLIINNKVLEHNKSKNN